MDIADAYRRTLRQAAETILANLDEIHRRGRGESVHDFRLAIKRIRALAPAVPGLTEISALHDLFRASGRVRDLTVTRQTIKRLKGGPPARRAVRRLLKESRRRARRKLRQAVRTQDRNRLRADLQRMVQNSNREPAESIAAAVRNLLQCRITEIGILSSQLEDARSIHKFRVKIKEAHYLNRLLPGEEQINIPLEETAELLGNWHDCIVAEKRVLKLARRHPEIHPEPILAELRDLSARLYAGATIKIRENR